MLAIKHKAAEMSKALSGDRTNAEPRSPLGLVSIAIKIGGKVLPTLLKFLKTGKFALGVTSAASYAILFSWQFALVILSMLVWHECGHLYAAKRAGFEVKGIYLIPFLGGVAVAQGKYKSRWDEFLIAIMGPIFGLSLTAVLALMYLVTKNPLFAAAAAWGGLLNLINLIPVYPLDGGRILSSLVHSTTSKYGYAILGLAIVGSFIFLLNAKLFFFMFLAVVGLMEVFREFRAGGLGYQIKKMMPRELAAAAIGTLLLAGCLWWFMDFMSHLPGADLAREALLGIGSM